MNARAEAVSRLIHDVAKYVSRAARNIDPEAGTPPAVLLRMLVDDLYLTDGRVRASEVFDRLAGDLPGDDALVEIRGMLRQIDLLEAAVRRGDPASVGRVVGLAREVEARIRALG